LRKKPTKVKNKLIVKPIEKPLPLNRTHLYTNPIDQIDDNRILRPYRKWRLAPPSS
jgi:hypothetical protein